MSRQFTRDFFTDVALGLVAGYSGTNKFGKNTDATSGDDVWSGGGPYLFFPATAQSMEILSDDTDDTAAGIGARQVTVWGLDSNWAEQSETVTLNGTTPVNLTNTYIRMHLAEVYEAGTNNGNVGNISVQVQGGGTLALYILASDGNSRQAIYTIPAGKTGYVLKIQSGVISEDKQGESAVIKWFVKLNSLPVNGAWLERVAIALSTLGTTDWENSFTLPGGPLPEKTDLRVNAATLTIDMGVVGSFDILLVDN